MLLAATHPPTVTRCAKWRERLRRSTARLAAGGLPGPAASRQPERGAALLSGENAELKRGQQRHNEEMHALDAQRREELQTLEVRPLCSRPHPYAALSQRDRQPTRSDWGLASSAHKRRSLASSSATAWSLAHRLARARRRCGPPPAPWLEARPQASWRDSESKFWLAGNGSAFAIRPFGGSPAGVTRRVAILPCLPTQRLDGRLLLSPQAVRSSPRARRAWVWRAERRRTARGRPAPAQASLGSGPQPRTATGGNTWSGRRRRSRGADAVCFCDDPLIRRQL